MVEAEILSFRPELRLSGAVITYGNASGNNLTREIAEEIETMWNEPKSVVIINGSRYNVVFSISYLWRPDLVPEEVIANLNPQLNFYRIEEFAYGNISFVDGIRSNTGYFKLENLYKGSTTAAHEFGHGLGLEHPDHLDIRGRGRPGIMYPRGTWVDPQFQYDSSAAPGAPGGTMHPMHRRVNRTDIEDLRLPGLRFRNNKAILGDFSNVYHSDHNEVSGVE